MGIAHLAQERRRRAARLPDAVTEELRELEGLRDGELAGLGGSCHRVVDPSFPEFTRCVRTP